MRNEVPRLLILQTKDRRHMKAADAPQKPCEAESKVETADRPKQWNGIRAAQTGTPRDDTRLGGLLQSGGYENRP